MKQRFSISRNTDGEEIVIKEYAELDKGLYSLLCEESYAVVAVEAALAKGAEHVITLLRTDSFFPTSFFTEKLIAVLDDYLRQGIREAVKIDTDDTECIQSKSRFAPGEDSDGIDDLLDVDAQAVIEDEESVAKLDAPIKIAEDETAEISNSL
ncbi:MAG: hypothetical protein GY697_28500 [Desulfobacterales bacterium]|nr:hypothetical protein [Desulfobacterales bacterium]